MFNAYVLFSNPYLLDFYGFCPESNRYNFLKFYLRKGSIDDLKDPGESEVIVRHDDLETLKSESLEDLTIPIKLKRNKLNHDLLAHIRSKLNDEVGDE